MKLALLAFILLILFSGACTSSGTTTGETKDSLNDTLKVASVATPFDSASLIPPTDTCQWTFRGNDTWLHDRKNWAMAVPRTNPTSSIYTGDFSQGPDDRKGVDDVTTWTQGRKTDTRHYDRMVCGEGDFVRVELPKVSGWMFARNVLIPDEMNLATATINGRTVKLGKMKAISDGNDSTACDKGATWFFYDYAYIYLIQISTHGGQEEGLFYRNDFFMTNMSDLPNGAITATNKAGRIQVTYGVPNARVNLAFDFDQGHFRLTNYEMIPVQAE